MKIQDNVKEDFVEANGILLHYVDWGNPTAPHLLFVHGWDGNAHYWDLVAPAFKDRFHIVALSLRGRGRSGEDPSGVYNFYDYVRDIWEVTQKLGMRKMNFVGASLGGMISLPYAIDHPEQVERLVLVDIGAQIGGDQPSRHYAGMQSAPDTFASLQEAEVWLRQWTNHEKLPPEGMSIVLREHLKQTPDGHWAWVYGHKLRKLRAEQTREELFPKQWHVLPKITCPVLIIHALRSETLLPEVAERTANELPEGSLIQIPDSSHFPYLEVPDKFIKVLRDFIG